MLDKKDLKAIEKVFDARFDIKIKSALTNFFETLLLPYFEHNEENHAEIRETLKLHGKRFDNHDKRFDSHDKNFDTQDKNIDSIYRKLEKNDDDHEEILKRLGKSERSSTKIPGKN